MTFRPTWFGEIRFVTLKQNYVRQNQCLLLNGGKEMNPIRIYESHKSPLSLNMKAGTKKYSDELTSQPDVQSRGRTLTM